MLQLIVLSISCILNSLLGLVVYLNNPKSITNRLFSMLAGSFVTWSVATYMSLHPAGLSRLVWIRLVLFCAAPLCLFVFLTFTTFPSRTLQISTRLRRALFAVTPLIMILVLTPLVFKGLTGKGLTSPVPNFGIAFFAIFAICMIGGGIWSLIAKYRRSGPELRQQVVFMLWGIGGAFGLIVVTNLLFVAAFRNSSFIQFGPAYALIFTSSLAYAIIRHRLFDIRFLIVRSVAYTLTLISLAAIYVAAVFALSSIFLGHHATNMQMQFADTLLALALAFTFQPVKQRFDRLTTRLFYQDAYDSGELLNRLNRILATTLDLDQLLTKTTNLIGKEFKAEFCMAVLMAPQSPMPRIVGTVKKDFSHDDIAAAHDWVARHKRYSRPIATDFLGSDEGTLKRLLNKNDIAILVQLGDGEKELGHLMLGRKKSGNPYNEKDLRVIETIANELLIAIENSLRFEEIQQFNRTLQGRVTRATKELRNSNRHLRELDSTKDDFISMASHQLRTPLTSVKGYISLVLDGDVGPINENQQKLLDQAFRSSQQMVYLISDLLNLSRLNTGKFVIEAVPTDLSMLVGEEVNQLKETAAARGLMLVYDKPASFPELMLDGTKIRQVVMNFIDNAIYYTPSGGTVTVSLKETSTTVEYTVTDNGIGVPKAVQHKLFSKFYRADNAQKARPDGTGLGLFMAKKVVVAQNGAIIFESQEGKGSTFGFRFVKADHVVTDRDRKRISLQGGNR